ncbi:MAG: hypothetical protein WD534_03475 [Phycisphaeraceae bacterium]
MRHILQLLLCAALVTLVGCSSSPSVVGQWYTDAVPQGGPLGAQSLTLHVNEDQTFAASLDGEQGQSLAALTGVWQPLSEREITFKASQGLEGKAQLVDQSTLFVSATDSPSVRLQRIEE